VEAELCDFCLLERGAPRRVELRDGFPDIVRQDRRLGRLALVFGVDAKPYQQGAEPGGRDWALSPLLRLRVFCPDVDDMTVEVDTSEPQAESLSSPHPRFEGTCDKGPYGVAACLQEALFRVC
jgi:hypothetical protein